jgi:hypothetical protein
VSTDREKRHCTYHDKEVFLSSKAQDAENLDARPSCEDSWPVDGNENHCDARCAQSIIFNMALEIGKASGKDEEAIKAMLTLKDYAVVKE